MQVRCHSPSQQWEKFLLTAALSYVNPLEEKNLPLFLRINIQTGLQRYLGGGGFIIVVMGLVFLLFNFQAAAASY